MLTQLYIDNVAVIEHADVMPGPWLTVLTGETGAGKSILIDALSAVLGERASKDLVRSGKSFAMVTATFNNLPSSLMAYLENNGYEAEPDGTLLLRRKISAENKSVCYIGGQPCTAAVLRTIGRMLVNIHGQHENQALLSVERHAEYLDRLGGLESIHADYETIYHRYCATHRALKKLTEDERSRAERLDMLRFQTDEIEQAAVTPGEEDALAARRDILRNADRIRRSLQAASQLLEGDEGTDGAISLIEQTIAFLRDAGRYFAESREIAERVETTAIELRDAAAVLRNRIDSPDFDPAELDRIEDRLALLRRLFTKYGGSSEAVLTYEQKARLELSEIEQSDEEKERLTAQLQYEQSQLLEAAAHLTSARKQAAIVFCKEVGEQLQYLDMPRVTLQVSIEKTALTASGADQVEFLISANPGEPPRSIAKIASGGELSRIMLALKTVMAGADEIPTLVFDEIDAGIGGRAAAKVGDRLRALAASGKQVLCVTHLAQIAACAHDHLLIEKTTEQDRTYTSVRLLEGEERCTELARMIGGDLSASTLAAAREMLGRYPIV
ncbi:MAG: DNA repair protein RecN [Clostridia bacterium]|nr:DNA repair protein RecN [Clostridia bacterium]